MNFKNFYSKTENRLRDSILSLWATGDADMQQYFSAILEKERLMAEPIFQTAFPWEPSSNLFAETNTIFNDAFINALDTVKSDDYRFPKDRKPYNHQIESWDTLINQKKSIAVTTGTGSGKTECFMLPVLYDIYANYRNTTGINALFLYPLNALIGSQKKRIDAWCRALGGITYAVYNGKTDENPGTRDVKQKLPELISRKQIRDSPPQILFTNPSMLEYILVRNKDVNLLKNSEGTLRWILLDEAHTLTGSSAAEMALLIRRVVDAFKVDVHRLRFAITSATVGGGEDSEKKLKRFMANLCGISEDSIRVITGQRVMLPELAPASNSISQLHHLRNSNNVEFFTEVQQLRKDILTKNALTLSDIGKRFQANTVEERLTIMDLLSERRIDGKSILPVRGHFFARGIGGMYVCTNAGCEEHKNIKPITALGTMTSIAGGLCKCGSPLLELAACRSCGSQLLQAEKINKKGTGDEYIRMVSAINQDAFSIENSDENEEDEINGTGNKFFFTRNFTDAKYTNNLTNFTISGEGKIIWGIDGFVEADNGNACPHCGEPTNNPIYFRLSSSFINRILADIFLEETPEAEIKTKEMLWKGHKYISFTDSRQGTAKISALINQDNEANWVRSQIYHRLCEKKKDWSTQNPEISKEELIYKISQLEKGLSEIPFPNLKLKTQKEISDLRTQLNSSSSQAALVSIGWLSMKNYLNSLTDFKTLFDGNNPEDTNPNGKSYYLTAILYDQFSRRLPRERSLENLGMVSLIYPKLRDIGLPSIVESFGISLDEWKNLLKIAVDYVVRYQSHFFKNHEIEPYATSIIRSQAIYSHDAQQVNVKRWPTFEKKNIRQNRLALLICAGLGYHEREDIDNHLEDRINELMEALWRTIKSNILSIDNDGFKLNLEEKSEFQLSETLWLCPVKKRLLDAQFRDYSPWIKGPLTTDNIRHYKIEKIIKFPEFPYPFNIDEEKSLHLQRTREWIEENAAILKEQGVWNNIHERIILNRPLYLSAEHSAQQNEKRLEKLEEKFERSEINILNCSTTMEMGVDIGGISMVIMNNVPPGPANYLQRAGRAGRRSEAKSLAFTICSPNPVGLTAMANPMWALSHQIAPPFLSFKSEMVVERHINAFFLGKFVQTDAVKGLNIKDNIETFFLKEDQSQAMLFSNWLSSKDVFIYKNAVNIIVKNTPLEDKEFLYLLYKTIFNFRELVDKTIDKKNSVISKLNELSEMFGDNSPAYKAVWFQKNQFIEKNAIGYLAEEGFLPSAGLPTGIVEFDTLNIDDIKSERKNKAKPSYFITRALSEFAPGNNIVIDGKSYISEGIILKNERGVQAAKEVVQSCTHCGYQRIIESVSDKDVNARCPHCGQNSFSGVNLKNIERRGYFTEMIQPAGFAIDIYQQPSRKINQASSVQYVDPLLINIKPWANNSTALFDIRESEGNAEILFYNIGKGDGYSVCMHCGRAALEREQLTNNHKRLRGGKNNDNDRNIACEGNDAPYAIHDHVILGGRFKTDFCEIRFKDDHNNFSKNETLLYTLGAVLSKELSHFLAIEEAEIGFGIKKYERFSTIFIFDTAKGGAGYSSQFALYAEEVFKIAKEKLSKCDCDKACTKCLIDRNTQWHIERLDRHLALSWLERVINLKVPNEFLTSYPNLTKVVGGIRNEIGRLSYANKIKAIWLHGALNVQSLDLEKLQFINNLKNKVSIHFVFDKETGITTTQDKISLIQLCDWSELWYYDPREIKPLKTVCKILTDEGKIIEYLSEDFVNTLNENWGNSLSGFVYKNPSGSLDKLNKFEISIDNGSVFEAMIDTQNPIKSDDIAEILLQKLHNKINLKPLMKGQSFEICYSDPYLKTPFGCILMVQFINKLKKMLDFNIESFTFKGKDFHEERYPRLLFHDFNNASDRNIIVEKFAEQLGIYNSQAIHDLLPHYRYFEFKNDKIKVIIRPDAGIEHGWSLSSYNNQFNDRTDCSNILTIQKRNAMGLLYTVSIDH